MLVDEKGNETKNNMKIKNLFKKLKKSNGSKKIN